MNATLLIGTIALAAALSALLIRLLHPWLVRYALARPNARSSHRVPTPQGGGIAIIVATIVAAGLALWLGGAFDEIVLAYIGPGAVHVEPVWPELAWLAAAILLLGLVGAIDDIRPLPAGLRLALQAAAVAVVVWASGEGRILPDVVPLGVERVLVVVLGLWFVNAVNFMDGIDWITVAEVVPIAGAMIVFGLTWATWPHVGMVAAALLGAMLGFAPANRPVARLFLGDVGSLPIGLMLAWMLYKLALAGHLAAALILPLYYIADAGITLGRRLAQGEKIWLAHRSHFYQRATDNGFTVMAIVTRIAILNLALVVLALGTVLWPAWPVIAGALMIAAFLVARLLAIFVRPKAEERLA